MSRDKVSPGDPVYCEHGVCRDHPCPVCDGVVANDAQPPTPLGNLSQQVGELEAWWLAMAQEEIERTVPKAIEYGSTDLDEIGRQMLAAGLHEGNHETPTEELGVYFYMVGKMARWTDAIRTGRRVSDDTLFDIGIYVRMVQRIRSAGGWPGINERTEG